MDYSSLKLKKPSVEANYSKNNGIILRAINTIIKDSILNNRNKIIINTNLKLGIPMENINKIAGPFIEAWAYEIFSEAFNSIHEDSKIIDVKAGERLNIADIVLTLKTKSDEKIVGNIDVKATSYDIDGSGKSPNITSFARIRSAYLNDPNFIFLILSIKHRVYSQRDDSTKMMMGVMEVIDFNAYDFKHLAASDISYNPALGTGQLQVRDIHNVSLENRDTWELIQLLDKKFLASKKGFPEWLNLANKNGWILV